MGESAQTQMEGDSSASPCSQKGVDAGQRVHFILRGWRTAEGTIRAELQDVQTGRRYPVSDLAQLPGLVQQVMDRVEC